MLQTVKTGDETLENQFQLGNYLAGATDQAKTIKKKKKLRAVSQVQKEFVL